MVSIRARKLTQESPERLAKLPCIRGNASKTSFLLRFEDVFTSVGLNE